MDTPSHLLVAYLSLFGLRAFFQVFLHRLNDAHLRRGGGQVPAVFEGWIDRETLQKITSYTLDSSRFGLIATLLSQGYFLFLLLSGLLPLLVREITPYVKGEIWSGLIFFGAFSLLLNLLQIPLDLYDTFVIEARHGFNTRTWKVWFLDLFKTLTLSALLGGILLALLLALMVHGGPLWWLWAWIAVGTLELLILWLYPWIIAPWFNRFEPIADEDLAQRIQALLAQVGLKSKGIFRMDASKRSRHTNAYFTGLGKSKRIVLFDTLLASHPPEEILAVLAHEIGHWKKGHLRKQLLLVEAASLLGFFLTDRLLRWPDLYSAFGFSEPIGYVGLLLIGAIFSPLAFFLHPLVNTLSRRFEREADDFAQNRLGSGEWLANSLRRIAKDNLADLNPHPLYAWFYASHPTLAERIQRLTARPDSGQRQTPRPIFPGPRSE
jgi:STE24 endopeptidase